VRTLIRPSGERIYAQWMSVDARIVRRANTPHRRKSESHPVKRR
jgi:hypothetical protein